MPYAEGDKKGVADITSALIRGTTKTSRMPLMKKLIS
jgi:hypothetical protein